MERDRWNVESNETDFLKMEAKVKKSLATVRRQELSQATESVDEATATKRLLGAMMKERR